MKTKSNNHTLQLKNQSQIRNQKIKTHKRRQKMARMWKNLTMNQGINQSIRGIHHMNQEINQSIKGIYHMNQEINQSIKGMYHINQEINQSIKGDISETLSLTGKGQIQESVLIALQHFGVQQMLRVRPHLAQVLREFDQLQTRQTRHTRRGGRDGGHNSPGDALDVEPRGLINLVHGRAQIRRRVNKVNVGVAVVVLLKDLWEHDTKYDTLTHFFEREKKLKKNGGIFFSEKFKKKQSYLDSCSSYRQPYSRRVRGTFPGSERAAALPRHWWSLWSGPLSERPRSPWNGRWKTSSKLFSSHVKMPISRILRNEFVKEGNFQKDFETLFWKEHFAHAKTINVELQLLLFNQYTVFYRDVRSLFGPTRKSSPRGNFSDDGFNQSINQSIKNDNKYPQR